MELLGYIAAILIGISLGLIGSGGSILTVPALVYLMGVEPVNATAYSLFIVGLTSLVGSLFYMRQKFVDYRTGIIFAIPALISVFLTRLYILPAIPNEIFSLNGFVLSKQLFVMLLFAILMFIAAISMIRKRVDEQTSKRNELNYLLISLEGLVIGILTGLVGAGGGFLIIPALVLLAKLPMKTAIGTSLLIIAAKSLIGFIGDIGAKTELDWNILIIFSLLAILGIFVGSLLSKYVSGKKLKPAFGWFVLVMSIYILVKEMFI